jgi:hypothetical protein
MNPPYIHINNKGSVKKKELIKREGNPYIGTTTERLNKKLKIEEAKLCK